MERKKVIPFACFRADEGKRLEIEVDLPGVDQGTISMEIKTDSLSVKAARPDLDYAGSFRLDYEVEPEKAESRYERGFLRISAPIKEPGQRERSDQEASTTKGCKYLKPF